jgi:hypothetical protein
VESGSSPTATIDRDRDRDYRPRPRLSTATATATIDRNRDRDHRPRPRPRPRPSTATATIEVDGSAPTAKATQPAACRIVAAASREAAADQSVESQDPGPLPDETEGADERWLPFQRLDVYRVAKELVRLVTRGEDH